MKKISLYSAICLIIIGIYSISAFSQAQHRGPASCIGSMSYKEPGGSLLHNSCLTFDPEFECKEETHTMSADSYQKIAKEFLDNFEDSGLLRMFEERGLPLPEMKIEYDSNNKFRIKTKNFPVCMNIFNKNGGKLPEGSSNSKVYIPYLKVKEDVYKRCKNGSKKVKCFFDKNLKFLGNAARKIFKGKDAEKWQGPNFNTKDFLEECMKRVAKKSKNYLTRDNFLGIGSDRIEKAKSLFQEDSVIEFDDYKYDRQTLVTSPALDEKSQSCLGDFKDKNKMLELKSIASDGTLKTQRTLYYGCNREDQFLPGIDRKLLANLEDIALSLSDKKIVDYNGKGDYSIPLSSEDLNNECTPEKIESKDLQELLGEKDGSVEAFDNFLAKLNENTQQRFYEYTAARDLHSENKFRASKRKMTSLQSSFKNKDKENIYDLDLMFKLAKRLNSNEKTQEKARTLFDNYRKLRRMSEAKVSNPVSDKAVDQKLANQAVEFQVCAAVANLKGMVGPEDCQISGKKTTQTLAHLKKFKEAITDKDDDEEEEKGPDLSLYQSTVSDSVKIQDKANSLVDVNYPDNPNRRDLDATIKLLENRKAYIDKYIKGLAVGKNGKEGPREEHIKRCETPFKDYDPTKDSDLVAFLNKIEKDVDLKKDKKDKKEKAIANSGSSDNSEMLDFMKQWMMYQAQMNQGQNNGFYNNVGGGGNNAWVMNAINGFSNQMYNMAYNNLEMHGLYLDRYNSMSTNMLNYQLGTTNYLLDTQAVSNSFLYDSILRNSGSFYTPPLATPTFFDSTRVPASLDFTFR